MQPRWHSLFITVVIYLIPSIKTKKEMSLLKFGQDLVERRECCVSVCRIWLSWIKWSLTSGRFHYTLCLNYNWSSCSFITLLMPCQNSIMKHSFHQYYCSLNSFIKWYKLIFLKWFYWTMSTAGLQTFHSLRSKFLVRLILL